MTGNEWQRSSFCGGGGNNCIEVAAMEHNGIVVRESDRPAQILTTSQVALCALVRGVKSGRFTPTRG